MTDSAAKVEVQPWMKEAAAEAVHKCQPEANWRTWDSLAALVAEIIARHAPTPEPDLTTHLAKYRDAMDAIYNDSEAGRELVTKHFGLTHPVVEPDAPAPEWEQAMTEALKDLIVAREVVDGWTIGSDGRCSIHKDVISKAVRAAIIQLEALRRPLPTD